MEITCLDDQDTHPVDTDALARLARHVLEAEGVGGDVELALSFVSEDAIAALNEAHLGHAGPTDVLSFAIEDDLAAALAGLAGPGTVLLGDVVICPAVAFANAPAHAGTYEDELELLVVHGILHLLGRDHEADEEAEEMEAREQAILAAFRAER